MKKQKMLLALMLLFSLMAFASDPPVVKKTNPSLLKEPIKEWCEVMGTYREVVDDSGNKLYCCVAGLATVCYMVPCNVSIPIGNHGFPVVNHPVSPGVHLDPDQNFFGRYLPDGTVLIQYVTNINVNFSEDGEAQLTIN